MRRTLVISSILLLINPIYGFPQIHFSDEEDKEFCELPKVEWDIDGKCYPIGERGPCDEGEVLAFELEDLRSHCEPADDTGSTRTVTEEPIEADDQSCNDEELIFWPPSGQCYQLLTRGPCPEGEWLVLESVDPARAKCAPVPCDQETDAIFWSPLCQCVDRFQSNSSEPSNYGPEDLCGPNSEILWSPHGTGICGCIAGFYPDEEGVCYELGSQGPCDDEEIWEVAVDKVACAKPSASVKVRVFDLVYQNPAGNAQTVRCFKDSKGRCRQPVGVDSGRFEETSTFLEFLNSFASSPQDDFCNTDRESDCPGDKIKWIDGQCYQPASTGPCDDGEWLVLDTILDGRPVMRCKERVCSEDSLQWTGSCSCVSIGNTTTLLKSNSESPCNGEGEQIYVTPYGTGVCSCQDAYESDSAGGCIKKAEDEGGEARIDDETLFTDDETLLTDDETLFTDDEMEEGPEVATRNNCNIVQEGFCTQDTDEKSGSIKDLITWLEQFPAPQINCSK